MTERSKQLAARIQDEHARLEEIIGRIREEIRRPVTENEFADWKLGFVWEIRDFQNELTKHFDLEEDGGFMDDLIARAPHVSPRVKALEREHLDAVGQLNSITKALKMLIVFDEFEIRAIKAEIEALFEALEAHEAAERELILEVYFQDIGVGD